MLAGRRNGFQQQAVRIGLRTKATAYYLISTTSCLFTLHIHIKLYCTLTSAQKDLGQATHQNPILRDFASSKTVCTYLRLVCNSLSSTEPNSEKPFRASQSKYDGLRVDIRVGSVKPHR